MADNTESPAPEATVYIVEARDASGNIASKGRVPADRLQRAKRLFTDEGWTVTVTPVPNTTVTPTE
jgi:hypothetical protein